MTTSLRQQVPLSPLSSRDHDGITVVSLRGDLDFCVSSALQAYLSDIRRQTRPRSIADITGLAFIDCGRLTGCSTLKWPQCSPLKWTQRETAQGR